MIKAYLYRRELYSKEILLKIIHSINPNNKIVYNLYGKPMIKGGNLNFNISHSGDWVIIGLAEKNIGIDIQKIKNKSQDFVKYVLGNEMASVLQFIKTWTVKESFIKWLGCGWGKIEPDSITVDYDTNIVYTSYAKSFFKIYIIKNEYVIAVCSESVSEMEGILYGE